MFDREAVSVAADAAFFATLFDVGIDVSCFGFFVGVTAFLVFFFAFIVASHWVSIVEHGCQKLWR